MPPGPVRPRPFLPSLCCLVRKWASSSCAAFLDLGFVLRRGQTQRIARLVIMRQFCKHFDPEVKIGLRRARNIEAVLSLSLSHTHTVQGDYVGFNNGNEEKLSFGQGAGPWLSLDGA